MNNTDWAASALRGTDPHDFGSRIRQLVEECPPEVRTPIAVAEAIREMEPGPEQYFWLELADSLLADPLVSRAIADKFALLDRRFALL
jgi:hypothetical protein